MNLKFLTYFFFEIFFLVSCKKISNNEFSSTEQALNAGGKDSGQNADMKPEVFQLWKEYVDSESKLGLQDPACMPKLYKPQDYSKKDESGKVVFRGVVLLFSGFSACPYQYSELGPKLAAEGYYAFAPVNPGHGRKFTFDKWGQIVFNWSGLPTKNILMPSQNTWENYKHFVNKMVKIIAADVGPHHPVSADAQFKRVVVGLSVGGAEATYAMFGEGKGEQKNLFNRALILAPFYSAPDGMAQTIINNFGNALLLKYIDKSWGPECHHDMKEGNPRKGGFCKFEIQHLAAAQEFGSWVHNNLSLNGFENIQFVGVEDDGAISINKFKSVAQKLTPKSNSSNSAAERAKLGGNGAASLHKCMYGPGVPHAFISNTDNQLNKNGTASIKPWIQPFQRDFVNFVTKGTPFPKKNGSLQSNIAPGFDLCDMP